MPLHGAPECVTWNPKVTVPKPRHAQCRCKFLRQNLPKQEETKERSVRGREYKSKLGGGRQNLQAAVQPLSLARGLTHNSPCHTSGSAAVGLQGRWWDKEPSCHLRGGGCPLERSQHALRGSRQQTGRREQGRSPLGPSFPDIVQSYLKFQPI